VRIARAIDIALHFKFRESRMSEREDICMVEMKAARDRPSPWRWSAMDWRTPHVNKLEIF
jgi:hypothetical protein